MVDQGASARPRLAVIVPAAGRGLRLGLGMPKALCDLGGEPLLVHAVRALGEARTVDYVVVVAPPSEIAQVEALLAGALGSASLIVVPGGDSRQDSVGCGIAALPDDVGYVLVHDAARCLVPPALVDAVADAVRSGADAVTPVMPVANTIKAVSGDVVSTTVDRSTLRETQTPQGFAREVLEKAHAAADPQAPATDDASLVERLGLPVRVVSGDAEAFKVTTQFDLLVAEAVLARRSAGE